MFSCLFGWRHASKCKTLVRRLQCRIELLKNKRSAIVRQLREDVAQLIKTGYHDIAIDRAEQLIKDKDIVALYELLDHFCEFIVLNMRYIRSHKDCPNGINEAVSSLIFVSSRCGDMPELIKIRKIFGERYGDQFAVSALELHPGNLVNLQIIEKLSIKSVTDDAKRRLVVQIASDYCIQPEILAFESATDIDKEMKDSIKHHAKTWKLDCLPQTTVDILSSTSDKNKETMTEVSSGETSPQFDESKAVYLDDVEEVWFSQQTNTDTQDKRLFKFNASPINEVNLSCKKECILEGDGFLENKKPALDQNQDPGHVSGSAVYNVFTYPGLGTSKGDLEEFERCDSDCSCSDGDDLPLPPYNRAMTVPSGWLRRFERANEKKPRRSSSCPSQYPNHVHPNLPDCDEIAAKFSALKKEYIQTSNQR